MIKKRMLTLAAATLLFGSEVWAGPVTDQLKETLDQLICVLNDPMLKEPGKEKQRVEALHAVLKVRFDEETIARKTLGSYWNKITEEEREEFIRLYSDLLERTYFERIDAELEKSDTFSNENIHYRKEAVKDTSAQVSTAIKTSDGSDIPVIFRLRKVKDDWLVIDMKIDGVILTKNYRAQFKETLSRNPMSALLEKLRAKQTAE